MTKANGSGLGNTEESRTVVAVVTYRRPDELAGLLTDLLRQVEDEHEAGQKVEILVVDNDPAGSARPVVTRADSAYIRYLLEPTPGIAAARNAALDNLDGARFVVFIDDDEQPQFGWLTELRRLHSARRCAAVSGPVLSVIEHDIDPWITAGRYFERARTSTGTELRQAATNNLRLDVMQLDDLRFDERFGLSGGSDTLFTRQLVARGRSIVWCDEAIVSELVPAERTTREWVTKRTFRLGNTDSRVSIAMAESAGERMYQRVRSIARGALRIVLGRAAELIGRITGSDYVSSQGRRLAARGAGIAAGGIGHVHVEYARDTTTASGAAT